MKKILRILTLSTVLFCNYFVVTAQNMPKQHVIVLDSLDETVQVSHFTLNTKKLYGVNKNIEVFNLQMMKGQTILLLSVLPAFSSNGENWEKIDIEDYKDKILTKQKIRSLERKFFADGEWENSLNWGLIKKTDTTYYLSKNCLAEFFNVRSYPAPLITPSRTINIESAMVTVKEMYAKVPQYFTGMDLRNDHHFLPDNGLLRREYLSRRFKIGETNAYQFWTFTDWHTNDGWNTQRGIDRFVYVPGKGIVGGSYDFWFAFKPVTAEYSTTAIPVSKEKLWDNIMDEKVMIAEELN